MKQWLKSLTLQQKILTALCLVVIVFCAVLTMTYGRTVINSDTAIAGMFADSFYRHHSFISGSWNYANGDVWTLYPAVGWLSIIINLLCGTGDFSRMLVVVIQMLMVSIVLIIFSRKYLNNNSWLLIIPLNILYLFGASMYVIYDGCYGDFGIWQPLICILLIEVYNKYINRRVISLQLLIYLVFVYLFSVRGTRTLADFILPMFISIFVMLYISMAERNMLSTSIEKDDCKKAVYFSLITLVPTLLGLLTYNWLSTWHNINNVKESQLVFLGSISDMFGGIIKTIAFYFEVFGYSADVSVASASGLRNLVSIVMCSIVCIIVPILQGRRLLKENKVVQFIYIYAMVHNLIMFVCGVFFSFVMYYHMISSVVLFIIVSARYIYVYWLCQENAIRRGAWTALFIFATVIEIAASTGLISGWHTRLSEKQKVADVLEEHGLTKGYATFWNAYVNQLYSGDDIRFGAITVEQTRLQEYWWLVDSTVYSEEDTNSFVMLSDEDMSGDYDYNTILYGFETPVDEFTIEDVLCYSDTLGEYYTTMHVYVYEDDYAQYLVNGSNDGIVEPYEMFFNEVGLRDDNQIVLYNGGLIYGPYSNLAAGEYLVTYYGGGLSDCDVEIFSEYNPENISYEIVSQDDTTVVVKLKLTSLTGGMQYRIANNTDDVAVVTLITVLREKF